jgi:Mor family transcriptional regulator
MKYKKASEILPDELLREVQKYAAGESLYIPKSSGRQKWGEGTGGRRYFLQRNEEIRNKYRRQVSLEALAEEYALSYETVRKIVYK